MRYKWGFKKDVPNREKGDPPKLLVRHLELIGQTLPSGPNKFETRSTDNWLDFLAEVTLGWAGMRNASELVDLLNNIQSKYKVQ